MQNAEREVCRKQLEKLGPGIQRRCVSSCVHARFYVCCVYLLAHVSLLFVLRSPPTAEVQDKFSGLLI